MNESSDAESPPSPIKLKSMEEVMALVGLSAKCSTKKNSTCDSPLMPKPMADIIRMLEANKKSIYKNTTALSNKKNNIKINPNKNVPKIVSFKIPKKRLLSNNKGNSAMKSRRETAISNIHRSIHPGPSSRIRKALFSDENTPIVKTAVVKASKPKISFANGNKSRKLTPNNNKHKSIVGKSKDAASSNNTVKSLFPGKQNAIVNDRKLSNSTDDEFKLDEYLCNLSNSSNVAFKIQNFYYLQELLKKQQELLRQQQALSVEINRVSERIYTDIAEPCSNMNGKKSKLPFKKVASTKKANLLKATLLKTVQEVPVAEAAFQKPKQPLDDEMTKSITMYNTMRSHFLQTPKTSRQSLEHGSVTISTTIQKQCLLLMDTPKSDLLPHISN